MEKEVIPSQKKGSNFDVRETRSLPEREDAVTRYSLAKKCLLDVSNWGNYAGEASDAFVLTDMLGNKLTLQAQEGNHIKIHLPGPRSREGDGADWVVIEKIVEERNKILDEVFTAITVRPCPNPHLSKTEIAHFFDDFSTNTLIVCRHKIELIASVHGRNELINTDTNWIDLIRNLMVALPAKAGLSNAHWKKLAKGLIAQN